MRGVDRRALRRWRGLALTVAVALGTGCASLAEFRKLEYEVNRMKAEEGVGGGSRSLVADLGAELEALREQMARLEGRLEVAEHAAQSAMKEARAARQMAHAGPPPGGGIAEAEPVVAPAVRQEEPPPASGELAAYRAAHAAWRGDETEACIDQFREFLQTYESSEYADDAAYWMADCYFKQGDYKTAILRFDDVAVRYPASNKAPDALYRQGEALLRLGPRFERAAEKAFERVIDEYPDSPRVPEARRQLEILATG